MSIGRDSTPHLSIAEVHPARMRSPDTRDDALRSALKDLAPESQADAMHRERRRYAGKLWRNEAVKFIREIAATAELMQKARGDDGELVFRTDARYRLLSALERIGGDPSISELARMLRISKQAARQGVIVAARAGLLELLPDPFDRRSIRIALTPRARHALASAHACEFSWVIALLSGLGTREMRLVAHVHRVIRRRLQRNEREWQQRAERASGCDAPDEIE